jgi:hypothetical protein
VALFGHRLDFGEHRARLFGAPHAAVGHRQPRERVRRAAEYLDGPQRLRNRLLALARHGEDVAEEEMADAVARLKGDEAAGERDAFAEAPPVVVAPGERVDVDGRERVDLQSAAHLGVGLLEAALHHELVAVPDAPRRVVGV